MSRHLPLYALNAYHRVRGREMKILEKQLPHDGYTNCKSGATEQKNQWEAHPLTLHGSLAEGDVRKGETTVQKFPPQMPMVQRI